MPKIEASTIEKYQQILARDPSSQVFAPLAEGYREMGLLKEALQTVTAGVRRHPQFVAGLVTFARIHRDLGENAKALDMLKKATTLSPENLLAHQLTAEINLATKNPKEALKAFKMVLFLNPQSVAAKKAVATLESLTADEYEDEVFAMTKLPEVKLSEAPSPLTLDFKESRPVVSEEKKSHKALERMLSLIDAFIVRNDLEKAHALLRDTEVEYGAHPEIKRRLESLRGGYSSTEEALPLSPLPSRENMMREKKLKTLQMLLRKIEEYRAQG